MLLPHLDLAEKITGNVARRTTHLFEDLRHITVTERLKPAARFDGMGGRSFRPYTRTYANGEVTHNLRDHGFALTGIGRHCMRGMPDAGPEWQAGSWG